MSDREKMSYIALDTSLYDFIHVLAEYYHLESELPEDELNQRQDRNKRIRDISESSLAALFPHPTTSPLLGICLSRFRKMKIILSQCPHNAPPVLELASHDEISANPPPDGPRAHQTLQSYIDQMLVQAGSRKADYLLDTIHDFTQAALSFYETNRQDWSALWRMGNRMIQTTDQMFPCRISSRFSDVQTWEKGREPHVQVDTLSIETGDLLNYTILPIPLPGCQSTSRVVVLSENPGSPVDPLKLWSAKIVKDNPSPQTHPTTSPLDVTQTSEHPRPGSLRGTVVHLSSESSGFVDHKSLILTKKGRYSRYFQTKAAVSGESIEFIHFAWPDHGTPSPDSLGELKSLVAHIGTKDNLLIQCRAGIGRTGVLTTILLTELGCFPCWFVSFLYLRHYRRDAVQNETQFRFLEFYLSQKEGSV